MPALPAPQIPFRGIQPFRYADHAIFFERDAESMRLASLVAVYRGVFLYGDSGSGKSSLLNAGLLPRASELGLAPVRLRVQPRAGEEIVVERIAISDDGALLPCVLVDPGADGSAQLVLSVDAFEERVRAACEGHRPLLVFDQFEELVTLFEEPAARASSQRLVAALVRLERGPLPVKLLFAFREDYLGRVKLLLADCPELVDQALRLGPPDARSLPTIIRGPFDRHPGHFERELDPALAARLRGELEQRFGAGDVSLSEVQTVCLRLWQSSDPDALLDARGVQGVLEDFLGEALDQLEPGLREAAVALLGQMVTGAGTRNVVSADDLVERVRADEDIPAPLLQRALDELERESKLVRRERRRDLFLYEITSEFLVPWISRRREETRRARERRRDRHRQRVLSLFAAALVLVAAVIAALAVVALRQKDAATRRQASSSSLALASRSRELAVTQPDAALAIGLEAYRESHSPDSRFALLTSLRAVAPLRKILRHPGKVIQAQLSPNGRMLATVSGGTTTSEYGTPSVAEPSGDETTRLWDARSGELTATIPHSDVYGSVAFSADGRLLAGLSFPSSVRLWDTRTGHIRRVLPDEDGIVAGFGFDARGRTLTIVSDEGVARVWNTRTGQLQRSFGLALATINQVAFSPDGRTFVTAGDGTAYLWDNRTGRRIAALRGDTDDFAYLDLSRDGRAFVAAGYNDRALLLNARTGRRIGTLRIARGSFSVVAFSPDGRTVAAGSDTGIAYLWDVRTRRLTATLRGHNENVNALAFSRDGRTLATASGDRTARLWDVRTGRPGGVLRGHDANVIAAQFSPDGRTLVTGSDDGTARLWDLPVPTDVLAGHARGVDAVAFDPGGRVLATASYDGTARLWSVASGKRTATLRGHTDGVDAVAFSPDGDMLATVGADSTARLWNAHTHRPVAVLGSTKDDVLAVAFSPDGRTVGTAGSDTTRLWNARTGQPEVGLDQTEGGFHIAFSPDGRTVASGGDTTHLWNARTGERTSVLPERTDSSRGLAFSPDGQTIAATGNDGATRLSSAQTGRLTAVLRAPPPDFSYDLAFSSDGRAIATACASSAVCLWNTSTGQRTATLPGRGATTRAVAFSPTGQTLATASDDNVARLWDTRSGELITTLRGHSDPVLAVAYSGRGQTLATGSADGTARLWKDVDWSRFEELRNRVCAPLGGGIGRAEWERNVTGIGYRNGCKP